MAQLQIQLQGAGSPFRRAGSVPVPPLDNLIPAGSHYTGTTFSLAWLTVGTTYRLFPGPNEASITNSGLGLAAPLLSEPFDFTCSADPWVLNGRAAGLLVTARIIEADGQAQ